VKNQLFLGLAGSIDGRDGFVRDVVTQERYDTQSGWDGRVRLVWNPSARWDLAFTAAHRRIDDHGGYLFLPTDLDAFNRLPALNGIHLEKFEQALDFEGFNASTANSASGQATYHGSMADVVYAIAWRRNRQRYAFDLDLTPTPIFATGDSFRVGNSYHEVRVQSPSTSARQLTWISGFAYQREERVSVPYVLVFPGNPFGVPEGTYSFGDSTLLRHFAGIFGQGTLRSRGGRVGVTAGLRYDRASGTLDRGVGQFSGFPGQNADFANDIWLPKFGVDVRLSAADLLYASAGRGWKTGGLNPYAAVPETAPYGRESSWTYEGGFRTVRLDRRVHVDAAVFLNRLSGFQDLQRSGIFSHLGNAERATSYGVDLDGTFRPIASLELSGSIGTTELHYDRYRIDIPNNVGLDGKAVPQVPSYNGSAHATYRFASGLYVRGETIFVGPFSDRLYVPPQPGGAPLVREFTFPSAQVYNAAAGLTRGRWTIGLLVRNIADRLYFTRSENNFGFYSGYTEPMGVAGARRVVSTQLSTSF
jgi:iron complex outermembrane receptor protein